MLVSERQAAFSGVGGADAEVMHPPGAAQGHSASGVEAVVAQAVVALGSPDATVVALTQVSQRTWRPYADIFTETGEL